MENAAGNLILIIMNESINVDTISILNISTLTHKHGLFFHVFYVLPPFPLIFCVYVCESCVLIVFNLSLIISYFNEKVSFKFYFSTFPY
jgi:hypothetical protein